MSWAKGDSFKLSKLERKGILLYLMEQSTKRVLEPKQLTTVSGQPQLPGPVAVTLDHYSDIFKEPKRLPPIGLTTMLLHSKRKHSRCQFGLTRTPFTKRRR